MPDTNGRRTRGGLLRFIELKPFEAGWKELRLTDDDLQAVRKMRFAPPRSGRGKRGGVRVGYVYLDRHATVLLVIAYSKSEKDDLAPTEKKAIRSLILRIEEQFDSSDIR